MTHPFNVGGTYANRKGCYEVVSLDEAKNLMIIRYIDTGETIDSGIDLQARIWENMGWEQQETIRQIAEEEARFQKGYGEGFSGLVDSDFKLSTENTTWRSRQGLAGKVSKHLSEGTPYTFVSWAIYGWPVAFMTHREDYQMAAFEMGSRKAKFTIELDEQYVYYGFYIEKNAGPMDDSWDWVRLMSQLRSHPSFVDVIEQAETTHEARFIGRITEARVTERFHFSDGLHEGAVSLWDEDNPSSCSVNERLEMLQNVPEDQWAELYIIGSISKPRAIELGVDVSDPMVQLMRELLPIYKFAV